MRSKFGQVWTCVGDPGPVQRGKEACFFSSRGRVWVHHLSLSSGHRWLPFQWWLLFLPVICIHKQTIKIWVATARMAIGGGNHCWSPFWQWPEVKLRWWTQTLPRLYRIHKGAAPGPGPCTAISLEQTDTHTWLKTLPSRNSLVGGN